MRQWPMMQVRIEDLPFSTRVNNVLGALKVETMADLVLLDEMDLWRTPNLGRKSVTEIKDVLAEHGLSLGMAVEFSPPTDEQRSSRTERSVDEWIRECAAARVPFLEQASKAGYSSADVHLGRLYLEGVGVQTDFRKARVYFVRAARRGNRLGLWNLALLYRIGYGVRRSATKVARMTRRFESMAAGVEQ